MGMIHGANLLIMLLFTVGFCTRITSVLTWLAVLSYIQRAQTTLFGMDTIMNFVLIYLMLGPSGAALSVDRLLLRAWTARHAAARKLPAVDFWRPTPSISASFALRLIQVHLCFVYLASGLVVWVLRPRAALSHALLLFGTSCALWALTALDLYAPAHLFRLHVLGEVLFPFVTSVSVKAPEGVEAQVLARSSNKSWLESKPPNVDPRRDWRSESPQLSGPHPLMVQLSGKLKSAYAAEALGSSAGTPKSASSPLPSSLA